jgi:hypothetical protein
MYLRFTSRANADGSVVRYVALAHNRRVDGQTKPDVLMTLGRVDQVDVDGLRRLATSIGKHFGDDDGLTAGAEAGAVAGTAPLEVIDARPIGATWLLDARCGGSWTWVARCGRPRTRGGSPRTWSGCCSLWSPTGRSHR